MVSKEAVEEFQEVYLREYGRKLSYSQAEKQANNLLQLYKSFLNQSKEDTDWLDENEKK